MTINMYVVYDKVLDRSSMISYAQNDREAYSFSIQQINKKISEDDKYSRDDFDIVFVGVFHTDSGLIEADYRIIDDTIVSDFKNEISSKRAKFLEDTKRIFNKH